MPNLLISSNRGFIPFSKNYEGDYLNFISETWAALGIVKEFDENLFPVILTTYIHEFHFPEKLVHQV